MSKLLSLFSRGGSGSSNTDAIRQSTTMTMAYLLEQNRKFEFFMRQKVERLEQLVSSQQQTRAEFEDDFADPDMGEEVSQDGVDETQAPAKPSISALVEDELLTATPSSVVLPVLPDQEIAPPPPVEEETGDDDDMSIFGLSSAKTAASPADEADSGSLSWEFYLGETIAESSPAENPGDDETDVSAEEDITVEAHEHMQALEELSSQPKLSWMVEGMVRTLPVSEEEMAAAYTPDMVEDTDGAVELGMVTIEDGKVVVEGEKEEATGDDAGVEGDETDGSLLEGENETIGETETVEGSGVEEGANPDDIEADDASEQGDKAWAEDQDTRPIPAPVNSKPLVVVRNLEASRPVRMTTQTLADEEDEEVEALIPDWLKNKLDKK